MEALCLVILIIMTVDNFLKKLFCNVLEKSTRLLIYAEAFIYEQKPLLIHVLMYCEANGTVCGIIQ